MWAGVAAAVLVGLLWPQLFLLAALVVAIVRLLVVQNQRDEVAGKWADELFKAAGLRHKVKLLNVVNSRLLDDNRRLSDDFDAVNARLCEVLREHAECPVPVAPPDVIDDAWLELLVTRPDGDVPA